jgi:hypothetical protein
MVLTSFTTETNNIIVASMIWVDIIGGTSAGNMKLDIIGGTSGGWNGYYWRIQGGNMKLDIIGGTSTGNIWN